MNLTELRHYLHRHPELSGEEYETHNFLKKYLKEHLELGAETVADTGLVVVFDSKQSGPVTLFRGDIDALPIDDDIDAPYKSKFDQIGHKCGHDGHTSIVMGLCKQIKLTPPKTGKVIVLFQPAEETGQGAKKVLEDNFFKTVQLDYAFALHNIPSHPKGQILWREDSFSASVISCSIDIKGATAHAGSPWRGRNPAYLMARVYDYTEGLNQDARDQDGMEVITPIYAHLGKQAYGIAAGWGTAHFTMRAVDIDTMSKLRSGFESFVNKEAKDRDLKIEWKWFEEFYANENDRESVNILRKAAAAAKMDLYELKRPFRWGEDFGLLNDYAKQGCMFGLGAGEETAPLHDQAYDFPDDLIDHGVNIFFNIYKQIYL